MGSNQVDLGGLVKLLSATLITSVILDGKIEKSTLSGFSSTFFSKKIFDPLMIHLIIDDYLYLVPKKYKLINISLKYEIPNEKIFKLIDEGYFIQEEDIIHSIQNKNIELARYLINNYNV